MIIQKYQIGYQGASKLKEVKWGKVAREVLYQI